MRESDFDVVVLGAGILGVTVAYWLSDRYDCSIVIIDPAEFAGAHMSSRNTGVIHRPFYLDPVKKRTFARTSLLSHPLWRSLAVKWRLPWKPIGTYNVALEDHEVKTIERYKTWGLENGMSEEELELLDASEVRSREPEVSCGAALLSKTDVSVDFGAFTRSICRLVTSRGVKFLGGHRALKITERGEQAETTVETSSERVLIRSRLVINAAGGGSLAIAHTCGLGVGLASLNFRGEYWVVDEPFASRVNSNIYRPPSFPQYPFLDPHFVVRADGSRQIGPNAVAVPGPYVYTGIGLSRFLGYLGRPLTPKGRLLASPDFIRLLAGEWRSSLSKNAMCGRVRRFVPGLGPGMLRRRAVFGVRSSVVDRNGFIPEATLLRGTTSMHILNFNSPGATGAPAFSALVVRRLRAEGMLEGLRVRNEAPAIPGWDFDPVAALVGTP